MTWRRLWTLRQGASEFGSRGVGKDEGDSGPIPRLLCLGGERRGEESAPKVTRDVRRSITRSPDPPAAAGCSALIANSDHDATTSVLRMNDDRRCATWRLDFGTPW